MIIRSFTWRSAALVETVFFKFITVFSTIFISCAAFVHLVNRQLKYVDLSRGQIQRSLTTFGLLVGGAFVLSFLSVVLPGEWLRIYLVFLLVALAIILLGEFRLILYRFRYKDKRPKERVSHVFNGTDFIQVNIAKPLVRPLTTTDLQVVRYEIECAAHLDGDGAGGDFKVVSISDFHIHPDIPFNYYERVIEKANQEEPDFVFLPGDFVTDLEHSSELTALLKKIKSKHGIFATLGNHDYWAGSAAVSAMIEQAGIQKISNNCVEHILETNNAPIPVLICGCDDPWGNPSWKPPDFKAGYLTIFLSHSPDNIYRLVEYPVTAVFSGHLHAGQFCLPGFGPVILPSGYGRRLDQGHFILRNRARDRISHLFVSAGIGAANPALRFYCQPDIFVVNFTVIPL